LRPWLPQRRQRAPKQLLHLVFGGELKSLMISVCNLDQLDIVGAYPNYAEAHKAWKAVAQKTVDNAQMRYHRPIHRLLDPLPRIRVLDALDVADQAASASAPRWLPDARPDKDVPE
jgi:hypothetical protein